MQAPGAVLCGGVGDECVLVGGNVCVSWSERLSYQEEAVVSQAVAQL